MTTSAGDAEAYRKLDAQLRNHRDDAEAWRRVGDLLRIQRQLLDPRYANRTLFSKETGLNYKRLSDIEKAGTSGRTDFTLESVIEIARAYGVTYQSVGQALEGGELEPLAGSPAAGRRLASVPPPAPAAGGEEQALVTSMLATAGIGRYLAQLDEEREQPGWEPANEDELRIWLNPRMRDESKRALVAYRRLLLDTSDRSGTVNAGLRRR